MPNIIVKSKSQRGFWRAGIHFTREGVELDATALSKAALQAIRSEPNLIVSEDAKQKGPRSAESLLGSDVLPATFKFGDHDAQLGDVVAFAFNVSGKTVAQWNAPEFDAEREALLAQCVAGFTDNPALFADYLAARAKSVAGKSRGKGKGA